jgi:hypothetical protein
MKEDFMFATRITISPTVAGWVRSFVVALLMALPVAAHAADISWTVNMASGTVTGRGSVARVGTAVMKTGETVDVKLESTDGATDDKGRIAVSADAVMQFKDGSSIATRYAGFRDPRTQEVAGSGEFVSGTGKYQGITGPFTYKGLAGRAEYVGTYSLKR